MRYRFVTCDVFTSERFRGNQLAVLPDAEGLSTEQMQQIAREFNFSETTFVFPPRSGHTRHVRIFTPATEVPFAGHPNIGTAFVLASIGELGEPDESGEPGNRGDAGERGDPGSRESSRTVTFEEEAGLVPIAIEARKDGSIWCELGAPESLSVGPTLSAFAVARVVSLHEEDIAVDRHAPQVASVGLPFLFVELKTRGALEKARIDLGELEEMVADSPALPPDLHLYVRSQDDFDLRARMFAPLDGVPEDPATGSASCALAGLLAHHETATEGDFRWRIAQGVEMGRPSVLEARAEKRDGSVVGTWVGGTSVIVSEGYIRVD